MEETAQIIAAYQTSDNRILESAHYWRLEGDMEMVWANCQAWAIRAVDYPNRKEEPVEIQQHPPARSCVH